MTTKLKQVAIIVGGMIFTTVALTLAGSAPRQLNFVGTETIYGYTKYDKTGFMRQPDCSITQYSFYPTRMLTPATDYQDTLHQLAALTTTPDVFTHGCKDPVLGVNSTIFAYLGKTSSGLYLGVQGATDHNTNLVAYVGNPSTLSYTSTTLATNVSPQVLGVDLNNDGKIDVIASGVTNPSTNLSGIGVFLSNGDGTFRAGSYYPMNIAADQAFIVDDLNGDGIPDILVPNTSGGGTPQVTALLGHGDGTFTVGPSTTIASISSYTPSQPVQTGDFNGDGKIDLLTADGMLYLGNGDGSFGAGTQALPSRYSLFAAGFAVGDFNGDGKLDVAEVLDETETTFDTPDYPRPTGAVVVYYGHGDGTFTEGPSYDAITAAAALVATDLDGDGNLDLLVARSTNGVFGVADHAGRSWFYQVLMGKGDGTFDGVPAVTVGSGPGIGIQQFPSQRFYATADFNGDKHPDLLMSTAYTNNGQPAGTGVIVTPGTGDGSFGTPILSSMSFAPVVVAAADINGDGNADAVAVGSGSSGATVAVLFGHGDGTLNGEIDYTLPDNTDSPAGVVVGDFNGDGHPDIAVAMLGADPCSSPCAPGVYVLLGQGGGTFAAPVRVDSSSRPLLATADLNGDGRADLVVADAGEITGNSQTPGVVHIYLGQSNGQFQSGTPTVPALFFSDLAVADLNKDGKPDIILGATDSSTRTQVDVMLGHGDGTFAAAQPTVFAGGTADPPPTIAVADFDGDGNPDVAYFLPNAFSGILFGAGDGTLPTAVNMPIFAPVFPGAPTALDLNGDQRPDLLVADGGPVSKLVALVNSGSFATDTADFSVADNPAAGTVTAGQSASSTVTLTPEFGFAQTVTLSCSGLPAGAACKFSPSAVTVSGGPATATLSISTTASSAAIQPQQLRPLAVAASTGALMAVLWLPAIGLAKRSGGTRLLQVLALLLMATVVLQGCGGGSSDNGGSAGTSGSSSSGSGSSSSSSGGGASGTPAGHYTVTITATAGSTVHTTSYTLTVN